MWKVGTMILPVELFCPWSEVGKMPYNRDKEEQQMVGYLGATASYTLEISRVPWAGLCVPYEMPESHLNKMI